MIEAIGEWGTWKGTWLGMKRIGRCHPWGDWGEDPVPKNNLGETYESNQTNPNR